jgi:ribosomal protein L34
MSITYNPKKKKRGTTHGFLGPHGIKGGRKVLSRRRSGWTKEALRLISHDPQRARIKASEFKGIKARLTIAGRFLM